jgi:hypothetical protein
MQTGSVSVCGSGVPLHGKRDLRALQALTGVPGRCVARLSGLSGTQVAWLNSYHPKCNILCVVTVRLVHADRFSECMWFWCVLALPERPEVLAGTYRGPWWMLHTTLRSLQHSCSLAQHKPTHKYHIMCSDCQTSSCRQVQ